MTDWKYIKSSLDDMVEHSPEPEWLPKREYGDNDIYYSLRVRDAFLVRAQKRLNLIGIHPDDTTYLGELTEFLLCMAWDSIAALLEITDKGYLSDMARILSDNIKVRKMIVEDCLKDPEACRQSEWNEEVEKVDELGKEVNNLAQTIMAFQPAVEFDWKSAKDAVAGLTESLTPYKSNPLPIDAELDGECSIKKLMETLPVVEKNDSWESIQMPAAIAPYVRSIISYYLSSRLTAEHPTETKEEAMKASLKKSLKARISDFFHYIEEGEGGTHPDTSKEYAASWVPGILHSCADLVILSQDLCSESYLSKIAADIIDRSSSLKEKADGILASPKDEPLGAYICDVDDVCSDAIHLSQIIAAYSPNVKFNPSPIFIGAAYRGEEIKTLCKDVKFPDVIVSSRGRRYDTGSAFGQYNGSLRAELEKDMINTVTDDANKMMDKVKELEETKDKKLAEAVAKIAKDVNKQAVLLGSATCADIEDVIEQCVKASSLAHEILNGEFDSASIQRCGSQNLTKNDPATAE